MRKASRVPALAFFALAMIFSARMPGHAQDRERFVISARAGGINAVTGRTRMHGRGVAEWQQLTIKDDLETGDVVSTGFDGRVEMLLNPGSYMRVGENSEFELADNSLERLEVRVLSGTAIVEATGADDSELLIYISTPHTRMAIVRRGLYRVNVVPGDTTELIVRKGRVLLADSQTKVKGGTKVIFNANSFSVAKLQKADKEKLEKSEKKDVDNLESWSKKRAETVAQANRKIQGRDLDAFLLGSRGNWYRNSSLSSGFWLFDSRAGCYTFLPFYFGWGSPYGSSYSSLLPYGGGGSCCGGRRIGYGEGAGGYGGNRGNGSIVSGTAGSAASNSTNSIYSAPASQPNSAPREIPAAAERRIERHSERMPNQP